MLGVTRKAMKQYILLLFVVFTVSGCAFSRPHIKVTTTGTNGVVTVSELRLTLLAIWPATQTMERQRGSIGKTLSLGVVGSDQDTTGTNAVEVLKVIDSILSKIHP